jgi:GT2 family glycosyltransferase
VGNPINQAPVRVLAVIVLYKMQLHESPALRTLQAATYNLQDRQADIKILLYDNTPGGQDPGKLPGGVRYEADVKNTGLAKAYNYALLLAEKEGFDWLLTLDQDTTLPIDFLSKLCHTVAFVAPLNTVAAIVPYVSGDGRKLSPNFRGTNWLEPKCSPDRFIGISSQMVYAANSASTIRVSALRAIGGYDPRFHLWASDLVMYHRLQCNAYRIFVAGNIHVEHKSSYFDLKNRSTPNGYESMLRAEEAFYDEFMGRQSRAVLLLVMFYRLIYRLWTTGASLPYFKITLRFFCRRLFYSRTNRMKSWKQSVCFGWHPTSTS